MATTVLAFGSFDIVHPGHLSYLEKARALGTRLVVVVARDESIMRFKRRRPLFREEDRLRIIGALKPVDEAVLGNRLRGAGDMFRILKRYRPDIVALGYDQIVDAAKLRRSLREYGIRARVVRIGVKHGEAGYKSAALRRRMRIA